MSIKSDVAIQIRILHTLQARINKNIHYLQGNSTLTLACMEDLEKLSTLLKKSSGLQNLIASLEESIENETLNFNWLSPLKELIASLKQPKDRNQYIMCMFINQLGTLAKKVKSHQKNIDEWFNPQLEVEETTDPRSFYNRLIKQFLPVLMCEDVVMQTWVSLHEKNSGIELIHWLAYVYQALEKYLRAHLFTHLLDKAKELAVNERFYLFYSVVLSDEHLG